MPKRSKKKKVWYPDGLFHGMKRLSVEVGHVDDVRYSEYIGAYNKKNGTDFDPTDAVSAYKKWERARPKTKTGGAK